MIRSLDGPAEDVVKAAMRYELGQHFANDRYWWYWREIVPISCSECAGTGDAPAYRRGTEIMVGSIEDACGNCAGTGTLGWQYASEMHGGHFGHREAEAAAKASAEERGMVAVLAR